MLQTLYYILKCFNLYTKFYCREIQCVIEKILKYKMYCSSKKSCEKVDYKYEFKEKRNIKFSAV